MIALLQSLIPLEWLAAASAAIAGLFVVWFGAKKSAKAEIRATQAEARLRAAREAEDARNEVEALDRDALKRRASVWLRDPRR